MSTCQICGREIKLWRGVHIAKHGFRRPGGGYQTASCYGADRLPYELSCEALKTYINIRAHEVERLVAAHRAMYVVPPSSLMYVKKDAWGKVRTSDSLFRPDGFKPDDTPLGHYRPGTYAGEWANRVNQLNRTIAEERDFLKFIQNRLDNWKAPKR